MPSTLTIKAKHLSSANFYWYTEAPSVPLVSFKRHPMGNFINLLRNFLYKLGLGQKAFSPEFKPMEPRKPEPRWGKIQREALLAIKDDYLVLIVDHEFEDIPSWVEWDPERKVISITQMGGQVDEANADINLNYMENIKQARKLLLVSNKASNDNAEKIVHYVPFLAR